VHVRWTNLLPSNNRKRSFKCESCGQKYDLSDGSKTASILGGVLSMGPGVLIMGRITRGQGGSPTSLLIGTAAIIAVFALVSVVAGRLALGLVRKP
jgi:hypothetical protein